MNKFIGIAVFLRLQKETQHICIDESKKTYENIEKINAFTIAL